MPRRSRFQPLARAVLHTQTDDRLVALARDGKEAAFEEIVRRYRSGLVAFAAAYGPPDPEDVVQESFVSSWEALRGSTGEMHLKAWLYTIVRNRALNARRDTRAHEPLDDQIDGVRGPAEIALTNEELDRAVAAVAALPQPQREALVRSALEGHTHDQIAASIGSTPGAVRQLIYRARLTVRHGVGAVIPLPAVAALAELGAGGAGLGAAAGGATAAGAAGGASLATKAAVFAAIGIVAAGSSVAIERSQRSGDDGRPPAVEAQRSPAAGAAAVSPGAGESTRSGPGDAAGGAEAGRGSDRGGDDSGGPGPGGSSGPGPGSSSGGSETGSGNPVSSGSGSSGSDSGDSGSSGSDSGDSDSSGSDSSGSDSSGSSGSGHAGPGGSEDSGADSSGPGGDESETDPAEPVTTPSETDANEGPGGSGNEIQVEEDHSGSDAGGGSGPG